jgi:anti-sigma factor RsiW
MSEHLSEQQIEQFNRRVLPPAELRAAGIHLATCEACRQRIGEGEQLQEMFAFLKSDLTSTEKTRHLPYEQLADYVDDNLDEVDREIAKSHLEFCRRCVADFENLKKFKAEMADYPAKDYTPIASPTLWERFVALWRSPTYAIPLQLASAAAVAAFFVWIATLSLRNQVADLQTQLSELRKENEGLQQNYRTASSEVEDLKTRLAQLQKPESPVMVALDDGDGGVTLDEQGNLKGLDSLPPSYEQMVKKALTSQRVDISPMLASLIGRAGILRSGSGEGISFALFSPVGTVVETDRPTFRWRQLNGAANYIVTVYDFNFNQVAASGPLTETVWTVPRQLERGGLYTWKVAAFKDGKEIISPLPPAPEAKFKVLDKAMTDELKRAKQTYNNSHLMAGILYTQAGLLDDAEREFQALLDANPKSPIAQKLLRNVKAQRQTK